MKLEQLQSFFATSPSAKLLRSPHAACIACFLFDQFKESANIILPHSLLVQRLTGFQERIHLHEPDVLRDRAETYATAWSTGDSRWLRRFSDAAHAEPVYELTPHSEDVLKFLNEVLDRNPGFIGTESRFTRILETLSDIVVRGSDDPARRLDHLRAERERIDREIESIEAGGSVATYSPTALRERFADAVADLASLQGDFRAVEESFKTITRDVQKQQARTEGTRGEILGFALDAEDALKSQDQGISFDEFVRLVLSPARQDRLDDIVARLAGISALARQAEGMRRIRGMMGSLSEEAEKVLRTTRRLSNTLRRLLDSRAAASRLRLAAVLREIRTSAARLAENPPAGSLGIDVQTDLDMTNVSERTFWTAPSQFEMAELTDHEPDADDRLAAFRHLAELRRLDWSGMRLTVERLVGQRQRVSLPELIELIPPSGGAIEVLGYVQIACDDGHQVDVDQSDVIRLHRRDGIHGPDDPDDNDAGDLFEVPRVEFLGRGLRELVGGLQEGGAEP